MQQVLNEIYFGKSTNLLKLEDLFGKLKLKYDAKKVFNDSSTYRTLNKDPILQQIGQVMSSQFGFKEVIVTFADDERINAYTIPFITDDEGQSYDMNERKYTDSQLQNSIHITQRGVIFDTKKFPANLLVCLNTGILFNKFFTVPELIAVLLHEVGHNFTRTILSYKVVNGKVDEKFADQFTAMYGYGPELVTAFSKMNLEYGPIEDLVRNVPIVNIIVGMTNIMDRMLLRTIDPHPGIHTRMISQVEQLESDLQYTPNLTPKQRKEIKDQLERIKTHLDTYYGSSDNMEDRMVKWYTKNMEPGIESGSNKYASKHAHPNKVNQRMKDRYNKLQRFHIKRR